MRYTQPSLIDFGFIPMVKNLAKSTEIANICEGLKEYFNINVFIVANHHLDAKCIKYGLHGIQMLCFSATNHTSENSNDTFTM